MSFEISNGILKKYTGKDETVIIPDGITEIGESAFFHCESLKKIEFPKGLTTIGSSAFERCGSLEEVVFPEGLTTLGSSAFDGCESLKKIEFPKGLTTIGSSAFFYCESLKKIEFPKGLTTIGSSAFCGCGSLEEVVFPEGLTTIEPEAFQYCHALKSVILPQSVGYIGNEAFYECTAVEKFEINNKDAKIEHDSITDIVKPIADENGNVIIGKSFFGFFKKGDIVIPEGVETVRERSVRRLRVHFPDSLRWIEKDAFTVTIDNLDSNVPSAFFQQRRSIGDADMLSELIKGPWREKLSAKDAAAVWLFQSKKLKKAVDYIVSDVPDEVLRAMLELLADGGTKAQYEKAHEFFTVYKDRISQKTINDFCAAAKCAGVDSVSGRLVSLVKEVSEEEKPPIKKGKADKDDAIFDFCLKKYREHEFDSFIKKNYIREKAFDCVKYAKSGKPVPPFVVKCAVIPYMLQLQTLPDSIHNYKTQYSEFEFDKHADKVAKSFDKASFSEALDILLGDGLPAALGLIIPYGRFANGRQAAALIARFGEWEDWYNYNVKGRKAIIIGHGALLLNDSREAMMMADKIGALKAAANLRGTTANTIRDTVISDFGFDSDGKKIFDLGGTKLEISIDKNMAVEMKNAETGKVIKSVPKDTANTQLAEETAEEIKSLKKTSRKPSQAG